MDFTASERGPQKALVLTPRWGEPGERYPLLIALHGRGESNRGLDVGARGWTRDYYLDRALARLRHPPLSSNDLFGVASEADLARLNESVRTKPFRGLVVVCPYTPDVLSTPALDAAEPFAEFLIKNLLPRIRKDFPVETTAKATGIDGVSLGGRVAMLAGFSRIESFGAIGTLQAAVRTGEADAFAALASRALKKSPLPMRILTSDRDPFRPTLEALAKGINAAGAKAEYACVTGPHDYVFNQGPGSYEMLLWHDRMLRGDA